MVRQRVSRSIRRYVARRALALNLAQARPKPKAFAQQRVAANEEKPYGPFPAASGTLFETKMQSTGSNGDPDLYVRFGARPRRSSYDCRPYLVGANETCSVNVPSGKTQAHVMVHGYSAGSYELTVTHTAPSP